MGVVERDERGMDISGSSEPATAGSLWAHWIETLPLWSPPHRPLLVVAPHPDDETLGAGGLLHAWAERRLPLTLLCLSDGEAAYPRMPGLTEIRRAELTRALRVLGFSQPHVVRLRLPDGELGVHEHCIADTIRDYMQPDSLLVAPFESDGHPDHEAAGRAALVAVRARKATLGRYLIWAWQRRAAQLRDAACSAVRFNLSDESLSAKQHAIDQFQSQLSDRPGGAIIPPQMRAHFARDHEVFLL